MATMTQLKKVSRAITGIGSAVANTFVEGAHDIAQACHAAFGGSLDIPDAELTTVVNAVADDSPWKGTSSEAARKSEIKAIVLSYTGLETAAKVFKREYGELRREHFVKLAREVPQCETPTDAGLIAVEYFESRDNKKGGGAKTQAEKLVAGLKQALSNTKGSKMHEDLEAFCAKYKLKVA